MLTSETELLLGDTARLLATAIAGWLAASLLLSSVRRAVPALRSLAWLDTFTLPVVRRWIEASLVVSLASGAARPTAAIAAADRPTAPIVLNASAPRTLDTPVVRSPAQPAPHTPTPHAPTPPGRTPLPSATSHVVVVGESLWSISAAEIQRRLGSVESPPTDTAIGQYWATVVATNRRRLRSANPNLIFPGEVVELPA